MIFTVVWMPASEQRLATIWLNATNRNSVTRSAHRIEELLRVDPQERGDFQFDTVRVLKFGTLGAEFEVTEDDRIVRILDVWDTTPGSINRLP